MSIRACSCGGPETCAIPGDCQRKPSKDSGEAPRNTPAASRGQAAPAVVADEAKRTDKTGGRGTDFKAWRICRDHRFSSNLGHILDCPNCYTPNPAPRPKPRKRTVGSIVVPELPWKRGQ